ncbi:MAG: DUF4192 domain-containing protein [Nocardioidaceae bacterium]|nr:DUF4192 domain-containing protein [Nocardioidaceae bacterium]
MTTFIARTPLDLLAVVPPALGFHPEQSVVLLTFGAEPACHVRLDLPVTDDDRAGVTGLLRTLVARRGARQVAVVLYTDDAGAAVALAEVLVPAVLEVGADVVDVLRVDDGTYFAVDDSEDPGTAFDLDEHPFTQRYARTGREVLDTREALAETLVCRDLADVEEVAAAGHRIADGLLAAGARAAATDPDKRCSLDEVLGVELAEQGRWLQQRIRSALAAPDELGPSDAGRMLVLVALDRLREVALAEMDRAGALGHLELWRSLVRRSPDDLRAGPAGLLAFAAWLDGQGALAWCALERCFGHDPDDVLGQHVAALLESATPPTVWTPIPERELRVFEEEAS